jgi:hypothetical protein
MLQRFVTSKKMSVGGLPCVQLKQFSAQFRGASGS